MKLLNFSAEIHEHVVLWTNLDAFHCGPGWRLSEPLLDINGREARGYSDVGQKHTHSGPGFLVRLALPQGSFEHQKATIPHPVLLGPLRLQRVYRRHFLVKHVALKRDRIRTMPGPDALAETSAPDARNADVCTRSKLDSSIEKSSWELP